MVVEGIAGMESKQNFIFMVEFRVISGKKYNNSAKFHAFLNRNFLKFMKFCESTRYFQE